MWELCTFSFTPRILWWCSSNKVFIRGKKYNPTHLNSLNASSSVDSWRMFFPLLYYENQQNKKIYIYAKDFTFLKVSFRRYSQLAAKVKKMWVLAPTMKALYLLESPSLVNLVICETGKWKHLTFSHWCLLNFYLYLCILSKKM